MKYLITELGWPGERIIYRSSCHSCHSLAPGHSTRISKQIVSVLFGSSKNLVNRFEANNNSKFIALSDLVITLLEIAGIEETTRGRQCNFTSTTRKAWAVNVHTCNVSSIAHSRDRTRHSLVLGRFHLLG